MPNMHLPAKLDTSYPTLAHPRPDLVNLNLVKYSIFKMNKLRLSFSYFTLYPDLI